MININVSNSQIVIDGHSGYAQEGYDIVCAAVSALLPTLHNTLKLLGEDVFIEEHRKGYSNITFPNLTAIGIKVLSGFCMTMHDLSEQFPDNVSYHDERRDY